MAEVITIGISMKDRDYAKALARNLDSDFDIEITDENDGSKDIFLTDNPADRNRNVLLFTGTRQDFGIYKYDGAKRIRKNIIDKYCSLYDDYVLRCTGSSCRITAFCSPAGGTGCSAAALAYSRVLAESGRALYMTLDDIPYEDGNSGDALYSVNRLLYIMDDMRYDMKSLLSTTWRDNKGTVHFKYLYPYNAVGMLDKHSIQRFIAQLSEHFDYIVADTGSRVSGTSDGVMEICGEIFCVITGSSKDDIFLRHAAEVSGREIIRIRNFADDDEIEDIHILRLDDVSSGMEAFFRERLKGDL